MRERNQYAVAKCCQLRKHKSQTSSYTFIHPSLVVIVWRFGKWGEQ